MKTSVHSIASRQNCGSTSNRIGSKFILTAICALIGFAGTAQTYTTIAAGNWNSASTWAGGVIPSNTIGAGKIVNVGHAVNFNVNSDFTIAGTLNITADTLRFGSTFTKKVIILSTGWLNIKNAGFLQSMPEKNNDLDVKGGRVTVENGKMAISKAVTVDDGSRSHYKNSTVLIGEKYELEGSSASPVKDTLNNTTITVSAINGGDYFVKKYTTLWVANAKVIVMDGDFKTESDASIIILPGAANNYGFNFLKVAKNLDNDGSWNARVDAHCVAGDIKGNAMSDIDLTRPEDCTETGATATGGPAPELQFSNPVLKSGTANKQGAVYRFASIAPGIDAEVKLKKFSRPDIVMQDVDLGSMGWAKAFQPQFGLPGVVQPYQNWYIDFELNFYKAGTTQKQTMSKIDLTALDVDGDGNSISEYVIYQNPSSVIYSTISYLNGSNAGSIGQVFTCPLDGIASALKACDLCGGDGKTGTWNFDECTLCLGSGLLYSHNNTAFDEVTGNTVAGPVENFMNIDTLSTQVMATYQFINADKLSFRIGAKSGARSSNGSGIRLNSTWFRQFSLAPPVALPVALTNFTAALDKGTTVLNWSVASEKNFSHFVVERSTDGKNYSAIATIFAMGAPAYAFKDANVPTGVAYYRLVMVDMTKEISLSKVRVVRAENGTEMMALSAYPNPAVDQVNVSLPAAWHNKPVSMELITASGIRVQTISIGSASSTEMMQIGRASKGMYIIKASCGNETAQQRVIKN